MSISIDLIGDFHIWKIIYFQIVYIHCFFKKINLKERVFVTVIRYPAVLFIFIQAYTCLMSLYVWESFRNFYRSTSLKNNLLQSIEILHVRMHKNELIPNINRKSHGAIKKKQLAAMATK